jgi:hypothetical protein
MKTPEYNLCLKRTKEEHHETGRPSSGVCPTDDPRLRDLAVQPNSSFRGTGSVGASLSARDRRGDAVLTRLAKGEISRDALAA